MSGTAPLPATPRRFPLGMLLCLCALATVAIAIYIAQPWGDNYAYREASGYGVLAGLVLWALSPYVGLAVGARLLASWRIARAVFATGASCIGVGGVLAYVDVTFVRPDAQGGLALLGVPLTQCAATAGLATVGAVLALLQRRQRVP